MIIKSENDINLKVSFHKHNQIHFKYADGLKKDKFAGWTILEMSIDEYLNPQEKYVSICDRKNIAINKEVFKRILCWKIAKDEAIKEFSKG